MNIQCVCTEKKRERAQGRREREKEREHAREERAGRVERRLIVEGERRVGNTDSIQLLPYQPFSEPLDFLLKKVSINSSR